MNEQEWKSRAKFHKHKKELPYLLVKIFVLGFAVTLLALGLYSDNTRLIALGALWHGLYNGMRIKQLEGKCGK